MERPELRVVSLEVRGLPAAQGSKDAKPVKRGDKIIGIRVADAAKSVPRIRNWRSDVKDAAERMMTEAPWAGPLDGPLAAVIHFTVPAVAAPRRVRWCGVLVPAVHWPWKRPDLDKFLRATFDALTAAGVWRDDSQVVHLVASKSYPGVTAGVPGAVITVRQLATVRLPGDGAADLADPLEEAAAVATLF